MLALPFHIKGRFAYATTLVVFLVDIFWGLDVDGLLGMVGIKGLKYHVLSARYFPAIQVRRDVQVDVLLLSVELIHCSFLSYRLMQSIPCILACDSFEDERLVLGVELHEVELRNLFILIEECGRIEKRFDTATNVIEGDGQFQVPRAHLLSP